jgi:hypothetical protein
MKKLGVVLGIAVLVAIGAALMRGSNGPTDNAGNRAGETPGSSTAQRAALGSEAVLAIVPGRAASNAPPVRTMSPALQEFYFAKSYAGIHARLKAAASRTPEEQWMLAEILRRCARIAGGDTAQSRRNFGGAGARERFLASLAPNDPDRDRRTAAFDAVNHNECSGLGDLNATQKEIRALLEAGAAGGDPKARMALLSEELDDDLRGPDGKEKPGSVPRVTDAQLETLRQVIASGDPLAIRSAATTLVLEYQNMSLRDAEDRPIDRLAFIRAAILLTCDYGLPCGPDSQWVMRACAVYGQCAASGLRDHMMYYNSSPSSSQVMASYEAALRNAARDANWSFFHFYPGPNPATAAIQTPGGP